MKIVCSILMMFFCFPLWGKSVYISSSSGADGNDGSMQFPLKSISAAPRENAQIFLKRGDIFYEQIKSFKNCVFDAYGKGKKSEIQAFKILENASAWERLANGIWRLDLQKDSNFSGMATVGEFDKLNIGAIYLIDSDKIYGHLVNRFNALNADGDFFVASSMGSKPDDTSKRGHKFKYLYFKSSEDLRGLKGKFAFVLGCDGVRDLHKCELSNITIRGFGRHGICSAFDCRFYNIEIDIIGGSIQSGYTGGWVRYGNGIEFWITSKNPACNNSVEACIVSRTYDCGATIQGISEGDLIAKNIVFKQNIFRRCRQAFEHFLRSKDGGKVAYENCEFSGNIAFECGENEFSTPELRDCAILSYEGKDHSKGLLISSNLFYNSNIYCFSKHSANLVDNIFYVRPHHYLRSGYGDAAKTLWANSESDMKEFLEEFKSNKVVLIDAKSEEVEKSLRKKIADKLSGF